MIFKWFSGQSQARKDNAADQSRRDCSRFEAGKNGYSEQETSACLLVGCLGHR